jgi:hypothetical protein
LGIALLRAIAERLIPGIPEGTRISILQQTNAGAAGHNEVSQVDKADKSHVSAGPTVLEEVIDKATARSEVEQEIKSKLFTSRLLCERGKQSR